ncbi:hypothetical protein IAU59_000555 [Kwoniella sp. CBS 9459]
MWGTRFQNKPDKGRAMDCRTAGNGSGGRAGRSEVRVLCTIVLVLAISSTGIYLFYPYFQSAPILPQLPSMLSASSASGSYSRAALVMAHKLKQAEEARIGSIEGNLGEIGTSEGACGGSSRLIPLTTGGEGVAGFQVFKNLWYRDHRFYMFTDDPQGAGNVPDTGTISSVGGKHELKQLVVRPLSARPSQGRCFAQDSIFLNTQIAMDQTVEADQFEFDHYHFAAESILGGLASLSVASAFGDSKEGRPNSRGGHHDHGGDSYSYRHADAQYDNGDDHWLIIPWDSRWGDMEGLNAPLVEALFDERFVDNRAWESITADRWIVFSKVVIVDRSASMRHNLSARKSGLAALPLFDLLSSLMPEDKRAKTKTTSTNRQKLAHFQHHDHHPAATLIRNGSGHKFELKFRLIFEHYRQKMLSYVHLLPSSESTASTTGLGRIIRDKPKIVFIDTSGTNDDIRLSKRTNRDLIDVLARWGRTGRADLEVVALERMVHGDQVAAFATADIVIGVHGTGLTHQLWMPASGGIIEIFPEGMFSRDQQIIAQVLGHRYTAISSDRILLEDEWDENQNRMAMMTAHRAPRPEINLNRRFFEEVVDRMIGKING